MSDADRVVRVAETASAQNTFTDWLPLRNKRTFFDVSISGISGDTVTLQRKRPTEAASAARDVKSYTADAEEIGEVAGDWDVRLGVKTGDYSAGTVVMQLGTH